MFSTAGNVSGEGTATKDEAVPYISMSSRAKRGICFSARAKRGIYSFERVHVEVSRES